MKITLNYPSFFQIHEVWGLGSKVEGLTSDLRPPTPDFFLGTFRFSS